MKVAIISFSGNNGKTTLAEHLFLPRMSNTLYLTVESINAGSDVEKVRGKDFGSIIEEVMMVENVLIDVGASNIEDFMKYMKQYSGSHEEFSFFVIPVLRDSKQINDTISTIRALNALGVSSSKIKVVMNKVDADEDVKDVFYSIFSMCRTEKNFSLSASSAVEISEIYHLLKSHKKTINELLEDNTDWQHKMREAKNDDEKRLAIRMISMIRLARSAKNNLDNVYNSLTNR